jgi:hypothetical protein
MWSRLFLPMGPRATAAVMGTPPRRKHSWKAATGAHEPKSTIVPAKSKITPLTPPRYTRAEEAAGNGARGREHRERGEAELVNGGTRGGIEEVCARAVQAAQPRRAARASG